MKPMFSRHLLVLFLVCWSVIGLAQKPPSALSYEWKNVAVGGGGFSPAILFSRAEKGLAYLRTDIGGAYRWDARMATWLPLQDGMAESNYFGIESIAADPRNPEVVYMAAGMYRSGPAAMLKSTDRGAHWKITPVPFKMGGNEPGRGLGERLAIDPANTSILYFGSRHDGLWRSTDAGNSWHKVDSFPHGGKAAPTERWASNAGVAFVLFDRTSDKAGKSQTIYAAVADSDAAAIYRSNDGGASWQAIAAQPQIGMVPVKGDISDDGRLFVAYANWMGPNGVSDGTVWRYKAGLWSDITPDKNAGRPKGGYMGISLGHSQPGLVSVATMNRESAGDTIWVSRDWGDSWIDIGTGSRRDIAASPFLKFDGADTDFGHWMAGLAIDPFDGSHMAYTTGATVYASADWAAKQWQPWVKGVEETAIIALSSPPAGAPLVSGFGDIAGFVHDRLDVSPPFMHLNPHLVSTLSLDHAGRNPQVMVRSGKRHEGWPISATLALSSDGGYHWQPLTIPAYAEPEDTEPLRQDLKHYPAITVSADGKAIAVATPTPLFSHDGGVEWVSGRNAPRNTRAVADKVDPQQFYMIDFNQPALYFSQDAGRSFRRGATLPGDTWKARTYSVETPWPLVASPFRAGELWFNIGGTLHLSRNGGKSFAPQSRGLDIKYFALGKAAEGASWPAIFAFGAADGLTALWNSEDGGKSWHRINDDAHVWGNRIRVLAGDPRLYGRVYVGTDGRGILYGDRVQK